MSKRFSRARVGEGLPKSYWVVLAAAAVLYITTCAPGVVWQDSGVIQYRVWQKDIEGCLGLALSHPLYYLVAIAASWVPIGEPAYRVNVTTALISAFAVANLYLLLRLWVGDILAALVGACSLALAHTFWRHATIPETYSLTAALLLLELTALLRFAQSGRVRYIYLLAFVNGLSVANHMLGSLSLICHACIVLGLVINRRIKTKQATLAAVLWMLGALPYLSLIVKSIAETGDVQATLASALFGNNWKGAVLNTRISARIIKENLLWIAFNYPGPHILLAAVGLAAIGRLSPRRWFAGAIVAITGLFALFAFRYTVPDRYAFFIPFYCMVSVLMGLGTFRLRRQRKTRRYALAAAVLCLLAVPTYAVAPALARRFSVIPPRARTVPYRDDYEYFLRPWRRGYRGAEQFAREALMTVAAEGILVADDTTAPPLLYVQQVEGVGQQVKIIARIGHSPGAAELSKEQILEAAERGLVYVVSPLSGYCPQYLLERFDFEPVGVVFRAIKKKS